MKRTIAALAVLATLALAACEIRWEQGSRQVTSGSVSHFCDDGYKFILYSGSYGGGLTQMWENTPDGPRPMECKEVER